MGEAIGRIMSIQQRAQNHCGFHLWVYHNESNIITNFLNGQVTHLN